MLYQVLIGPLVLLFEAVYAAAYTLLRNAGAAILPLSLAVNLLLLPFYRQADRIQDEARAQQSRMSAGVAHIKRAFRGDERTMMLQTYYGQNGYKPWHALKGAVPLMLELPFFIAAYRFLSGLSLLNGVRFGPIRNLGAPDALLSVAGVSVNLLPVVMTAVNIVSSSIYARGQDRRERLKLCGMALIFLALLYNSPSGLVLYWALNNCFSLLKNLVGLSKRPRRAATALCAVAGAAIIGYGLFVYEWPGLDRFIVVMTGVAFLIPLLSALLKRFARPRGREDIALQPDGRMSLWGCVFLTLLSGALIPSAVVRASPAEFVVALKGANALWPVFSALLIAAGTFLVWLRLFYHLAGPRARAAFDAAIWVLCGVSIVDYLFFGTHLGTLTAQLQYESLMVFSNGELTLNLEVALLLATALMVVWIKRPGVARAAAPLLAAVALILSAVNVAAVGGEMPKIQAAMQRSEDDEPRVTLSAGGKNVVVLMLDRAIDSYIPYLFNEKPELRAQFDGFTWYPNTVSFAPSTNTGSACVFGGYEYTPEAINRRADEPLADKQEEALKVMPALFDAAGYGVTVWDPPYAGYDWVPDLSIYDDYPNIRAWNTEQGHVSGMITETEAVVSRFWNRNFFCYSLMKMSPLILQIGLYQDGTYFNPDRLETMNSLGIQVVESLSTAYGMKASFFDAHAVLSALPELTVVEAGDGNTFSMLYNSTTHEPMMLQEPDYIPLNSIDNTEYDRDHADRFTVDGRTLNVSESTQMIHYQINMAAMLRLGRWFDALRENGVYDNTRIILVADHGMSLNGFADWRFGSESHEDVMRFNPLLMVKDFGAKGFTEDRRFMTNADTPTLAMDGLIDDPVNPFTGVAIDSAAKDAPELHIFYSEIWQTSANNGNTFLPGTWYGLKNQNIFDMNNWRKLGDY